MFVWAMRAPEEMKRSFDPSHSWILGNARGFVAPIAVVTMVVLIIAGVALLLGAGIWRPLAVFGLALSLVLDVLFFNPWLAFIALVNSTMIYGMVARHWPSVTSVGS
jgi:hypothetical protein